MLATATHYSDGLLGQQGTAVTRAALEIEGVELVGIADLYEGRRVRAQEAFGPDVVTTRDYRELLEREDIDAVIVATSDHRHARICIDAMHAGKDVYCEKPLVQKLAEGPRMIAAERETGRILQVGSQRTSSQLYHQARRLIREGAIGQLILVEAWYHRSSDNGAWLYVVPPDGSPQTVDWERFLGDAPNRPFDAKRFFRWRNYWDYGTAIPGDLFVHLLTGLHFVVDNEGPETVLANGGLRFWRASGRANPLCRTPPLDFARRGRRCWPIPVFGRADSAAGIRSRASNGVGSVNRPPRSGTAPGQRCSDP